MLSRPVILILLFAAAGPAWGQGADFGGAPKKSGGDGNLDAQEGLESATPTDDVNELNSGGGGGNPAPPGGGDDFPAAGDGANDDKGLFGDGDDAKTPAQDDAKGAGGGKNATGNGFSNAFGGGNGATTPGANAAAANAAAGGKGAPNDKNGPAAPPPTLNATPNAAPANAESLLKNSNAAPPAVNAAPAANAAGGNNNTPAAPTASQPATGQEELVKKPAEPPPIEAPPLPPPNDFAGVPPVPGTMRIMAEGEAPEEYKVEPGDTLWDICDQLLDEAPYWPKLWALNPEIKNPHFIFPNMRLRFYPGDDDNPPYLQVVSEDDVIPIDKGDLDEQELVAEKVIFPTEQAMADEQITEVIGPEGVDALTDEILMGGRIYQGGEIKVQVPGFIFAAEKDPLGYVIGGREGEISMQPGVKGLVESVGGLAAGTLYSVLRLDGKIDNPETGDNVGYKYYFVGNIRIEKDLGDAVFVGKAQDNRLSLMPDDIVVNYISTKRSVPQDATNPPLNAVDATVIAFEYPQSIIGGEGHYAFIDKGNGDGVSPGMYLPLYQTPGFVTSEFGSGNLPIDYEYVGVMRIIDTTDAGAVGYVLKNVKEVRVGDRTGKG